MKVWDSGQSSDANHPRLTSLTRNRNSPGKLLSLFLNALRYSCRDDS